MDKTKKTILSLVVMICCLVSVWTPKPASAEKIERGEIIGTNVTMRKEADSNSDILCKLSKGTIVDILQSNVDAQWYKVQYNGKTGYVNRVYISLDCALNAYDLDYVGTVINCKQFINVRSASSTKASALGTANKGAKLKVLQKNIIKGWHKVEFQGKTGYVSSKYLDVTPKVSDSQLTALSVSGGIMSPSFSPNEYGYMVTATSSKVTINAKANSGVNVDINGSGQSKVAIEVPSGGMKTVRIDLDGKTRYSVYIARNVITFGTWNIKRGDGNLLMQGRLVYNQRPDIMGIQEVFQDYTRSNVIDNLASLKTSTMAYTKFAKTIGFSNGSEYGIGMLSRYKLSDIKTYPLDSGGYEKRILMRATITINGKKVNFYNTHFSYNNAEIRAKQFEQVKEIMNKDKAKYKILCGDFNAKEAEFAQLGSNYTLVHTGDTNYLDYFGNKFSGNIIDNFIVTKNIKVVNSRIIKTSLSDHDPLFAYLVLQ